MKLIVQPGAGIAPVVTAIKQAKKTIDILIFRLDRQEIARALWAETDAGKKDAKRAERAEKKGGKEPGRAEAAAS